MGKDRRWWRRILDVPPDGLSEADRKIVQAAVGEYRAALSAQADFPEVQLNLAPRGIKPRLGPIRRVAGAFHSAVTDRNHVGAAIHREASSQ